MLDVSFSGAANGGQGARAPTEMRLNLTHNRTQRHTRTFIAHLFTLNGLKQTLRCRTTVLSVYSLARESGPITFNTKERRGAIFTSKCTRNCLAAGLCETRPAGGGGAYNAPLYPLTGFKG